MTVFASGVGGSECRTIWHDLIMRAFVTRGVLLVGVHPAAVLGAADVFDEQHVQRGRKLHDDAGEPHQHRQVPNQRAAPQAGAFVTISSHGPKTVSSRICRYKWVAGKAW